MTCMHIVSFLLSISCSLWSFKRWWIDPSDRIPSPISCLSALTFSICPMHPRSSVSERTALLQDGRHWNGRGRDENGLTLSWLIGPIMTSHFLWWSSRQLPSLISPPSRCESSRRDHAPRLIYRSKRTRGLEVDSLILPGNHLVQCRRCWKLNPST